MTFQTKRKLVVASLVFLTIWPLVHHVAVRTLDLNPWKWFGWSMYTTPPRRVRAEAVSLDERRVLNLQGVSEEGRRHALLAYSQFMQMRADFGQRIEPVGFARAMFDVYPTVQQIKVTVQDVHMDRETAMIVPKREQSWTYDRSELD